MALARAVDAALAAYRDYREALSGLAEARKAAGGRPKPDVEAADRNAKRRLEAFLAAYQDAMEKIEQVSGLIDDIMADENWAVVSVGDDDDDMDIHSDDVDMAAQEAGDAAASTAGEVVPPPSNYNKNE